MDDHEIYLREAIAIGRANIEAGGTPYGAVIVQNGRVISRAANQVHATHDPTAHAEALALREAGRLLGRAKLDDCIVYASGRPCPMCHAAMRLAGIGKAYFAFTAEQAAQHGAANAALYTELARPLDEQPMRVQHLFIADEPPPYAEWAERKRG